MDEQDKRGLPIRLGREQSLRALPWLALLLLLLGLWMAVSGGLRWWGQARVDTLTLARDEAAGGVQRALAADTGKLQALLASPAVRGPLQAGDAAAAAQALRQGWPEARQAEFWPQDLEAQYAGLPRTGYGRLAVAEAALAAGKPVARAVRHDGRDWLALAAPVADADPPLLAYVELPLGRIADAVTAVALPEHTYLALRQGGRSVVARGEDARADAAEALGTPVPGTDLRIAAAAPDVAHTPFDLPGGAALVAGGVLVGLALMLWLVVRPRLLQAGGEAGPPAPTLAELQAQQPAPAPAAAPKPAPVAEPAAAAPAAAVAIDRGIFRAYDIRGVVGQTLDAGVAELIGQAIGSLMHEQGLDEIVVGRDGRHSGPALVEALIAGLRKAGRNVIDIGLVPTPVVYFGTYHLRTGCGVAVTGSHNPPDYNGFKIVVGAETLSGDAIADLHVRIAEDRLHTAPHPGGLEQRDIGEDYVARIAGDIQLGRRLKVVVDAGNGAAGELGPRVLEAIGAEVERLYCDIDGDFPNHHPDPGDPHNLEALVQIVQRLQADLGIAFDGDGDRLGVVTTSGKVVYPDRLLMLFAADVLQRNPGATVIYDVKCSGQLAGHILRHGGSPLMWKTGHSLIKAKMRETEAALAGEMSGHFFFGERWYGFDDGLYAAARLLEIVDAADQPATALLESVLSGVSTPELKLPAPEDDPHAFVERFRAQARFEGARVTTIDGVRVDWPDGWGLVRASNTTPVVVMRFDADTPAAMARIQEAFRAQLLALDPTLALPF